MKQEMTQQTLLYLYTAAEVHASSSSSSHCFAFNHTAYILSIAAVTSFV